MYDSASIAPYVKEEEWRTKPPKLAMSIGGENRVGLVSANNLNKLVDRCNLEKLGITSSGCRNLLVLYANSIPGKLAAIFESLEKTASAETAKELRAHMEKPIAQLCAKSIRCLER